MNVRITAVRRTEYRDLMEKYENPIEHTCDIREGDSFLSVDGEKPDGFCDSAWKSLSVCSPRAAETFTTGG